MFRLLLDLTHHLSFVSEEGMAGCAIAFGAKYGKDAVVCRIRRAVGDAGGQMTNDIFNCQFLVYYGLK